METITYVDANGVSTTFYPQSYTDQAVSQAVANATAAAASAAEAIDNGSAVVDQNISTVN